MSAATIPSVYATALLELANERGNSSAVIESCMGVLSVLRENPALQQQLDSPQISRTQAKDILTACFGDKIEGDVLTFLKLLVDRDRVADAIDILEAIIEAADKAAGIVNVYVCSAQPLDAIVSQQVSRSLGSIFGEGIVMHNSVDPDMLGGLTVRVGGYLIDGSVRRHLTEMKKHILETPIQGDLWDN